MPRHSPRKSRRTVVESTTTDVSTKTNGTPKGKAKAQVAKRKVAEAVVDKADAGASAATKKRKAAKEEIEEEEFVAAVDEPRTTKKRKSAKAKPEDTMPLAERTAINALKKSMYLGAHVSSAGGVHNSIPNAVHIGANALALFLKSQRKWNNPPIPPEARDGFRNLSQEHKFEVHKHCLPHGSYLVNLAQLEREKADQAYGAFLDDLQRCESLGIKLYNFHPGNSNGEAREEAIGRIAAQLNKSHRATSTVVTVLENMAGQGNVIGSTFEDLRDIIALIDDKSRVGVCIDTCHAFAAGYDLRSPEAFQDTMARFDSVVGAKYLKALHMNDSKAPLDSRRDLHANIGTGFLGLRAFHNVMNHAGFEGIPMILETPIDRKGPDGKTVEDKQVWADEIKLLESLIGMDLETDEFKALDERLQAQGAGERAKIEDQVVRKSAKDAKKGTTRKRGKKKASASDEEDSE
ncbi:AP endonuclease [Xylariaceae sp. FL0662B]|nr:AP endonuclease [Xylariaceae sp. FL0662B]